jgi:hypothetical protein
MKPVRNPNKRPCVARNITFSVQRENEEILRYYGIKGDCNMRRMSKIEKFKLKWMIQKAKIKLMLTNKNEGEKK